MSPLIAFALGALLALAVLLAAVAIGARIARARALRASDRAERVLRGKVTPPRAWPEYRGHLPPRPLPPRHAA